MVVMHRLWTKHCGGWSETPSDRLVDRIEMLGVQSGCRVAGFGHVQQSLVR